MHAILLIISMLGSANDNCVDWLTVRELSFIDRARTIDLKDRAFFADAAFLWPIQRLSKKKIEKELVMMPRVAIRTHSGLEFTAQIAQNDPLALYIEHGKTLYLATVDRTKIEASESAAPAGLRQNAKPNATFLAEAAIAKRIYTSKRYKPTIQSSAFTRNQAYVRDSGEIFQLLNNHLSKIEDTKRGQINSIVYSQSLAVSKNGAYHLALYSQGIVVQSLDSPNKGNIRVTSVDFEPKLTAVSNDGARIAVINPKNNAIILFIDGYRTNLSSSFAPVQELWFSDDGATLHARVPQHKVSWDLESLTKSPDQTPEPPTNDFQTQSPDGRRVVLAKHNELIIKDAQSQKTIQVLPLTAKQVLSISFSPSGKKIAVGYEDGYVEIFTER